MKALVKKGRGTDLNGWIGDRVRTSITGAFKVLGENDNGRREVEFCVERGLYVGNTLRTQGWEGAKIE